jgi:FMN phosphatase YigB (HAD superfamily)
MKDYKIPVFDIGDTLIPCSKIQEQLLNSLSSRKVSVGNNFRIYKEEDVQRFANENGIDAEAGTIIQRYKKREEEEMRKEGIIKALKKISERYGPIGFISDNTIEGKKWFKSIMDEENVNYSGLVVSEEVGAEKPNPKIFKKFVQKRSEKKSNQFVYFGNNLNRDIACQKVGMNFIEVTKFNVIGSTEKNVKTIDSIKPESVGSSL